MTATHFGDRLLRDVERKDAPTVVGLDPRPAWLPTELREAAEAEHGPGLRAVAEACGAFCREVIDQVEPHVAAVKPQIAFFEELGADGVAAYGRVVAHARSRGLLVIGDAKRADIASTAEAYARGHLGDSTSAGEVGVPAPPPLQVDALTVNPYLGTDSIAPFVERAREGGRGLFVLCRTSNPGAPEFQDRLLEPEGGGEPEPLHLAVARAIVRWGAELVGERGLSSVGAVVGATADASLLEPLREILRSAPILVPGFGAQGGGASELEPLFAAGKEGVIVNSSRGVIFSFRRDDADETRWRESIASAARSLREEVCRARDSARRRAAGS